MKQVVTCQEMKSCDSYTIERMGVPSCVLMERAALKVVEELEKRFTTENIKQKILCVCGSGNNGGDGVAIARILHQHGYQSAIYLAGNPDHRTEEMQRQCQIAVNYQVSVVNNLHSEEYTTIVDAIFGVGLTREIKGEYRELIAELNEMPGWKVAVDLPSGVDGDTGAELGIAFHTQVAAPKDLPCSEMIFCAILSNILENAMNAVKDLSLENRRIELHIFEKMNHLMLLEKNPAPVPPVFSDGIPVTRRSGHGLGVKSIIYYVESQQGQYQFFMEGTDFAVRIIL